MLETSLDAIAMAPRQRLAGQRVLVTGARGFLGAPLSLRLREAGAEVHAVSRIPRTGGGGLTWWRASMEDPEEVRTLLDEVKPDLVFHLGGHVTAAANLELVTSTFQSLLASTVTLLTEATRVGCRRLVLAGSLEEPIGLAAEATPTSPYGAAKWAAGAYARMFHALYGTPAVILRPFMAYGPGQPEHRVVPHAIRSYLRGVPPRLSSARRRFDWVFVDDVVDALLLAAHRPGLEGATIDLGSGQAVTVRDVVMRIKEIVGSLLEPEFGTEPDRPGNETRVADTAHTRAILGWRATIPLDAGLARAVAWYRAQPLDIRSPS